MSVARLENILVQLEEREHSQVTLIEALPSTSATRC